jgi:hypothetical protein
VVPEPKAARRTGKAWGCLADGEAAAASRACEHVHEADGERLHTLNLDHVKHGVEASVE